MRCIQELVREGEGVTGCVIKSCAVLPKDLRSAFKMVAKCAAQKSYGLRLTGLRGAFKRVAGCTQKSPQKSYGVRLKGLFFIKNHIFLYFLQKITFLTENLIFLYF
jgi:hypothetical protein